MSDLMVATRQVILLSIYFCINTAHDRIVDGDGAISATGFFTIIDTIPFDGIVELYKLLATKRCSDSGARVWDTARPSATLPSVDRRDVGTNTCELFQMAFDADNDNSDAFNDSAGNNW